MNQELNPAITSIFYFEPQIKRISVSIGARGAVFTRSSGIKMRAKSEKLFEKRNKY
jgi:hypothetical protein